MTAKIKIMSFAAGVLCVTAIILAAVLFASCGQAEKQDAEHAQPGTVDRSAPDFVIAFPDDYRNAVAKCDGHGHMVFVTSHDADQPSAIAVINDDSCR